MSRFGLSRPRLVAFIGVSAVAVGFAPLAFGSSAPPPMPRPLAVSSLPKVKPVAPKAETTSIGVAGQAVPGDAVTREVKPQHGFSLVVFGWKPGAQPDDIQWRSRTETGQWSGWHTAEAQEGGRDGVAGKPVTEVAWTGPASRIQAKASRKGAPVTQDLSMVTIDPGVSPNDAQMHPAAGSGVPDEPTIVTRAQWGADESKMTWAPEYTETVKAAALHHTANSNDYTCDQSASLVRGIYYAHAVTNGWGDIGYNALVDKCGTVFEGRTGGLDLPVIGAHALGFNRYTFGVSMIGDYNAIDVPAATQAAVAKMFAWKLSNNYDDPNGTVALTEGAADGSSKWPNGTTVTLPTIFAHRDVYNTECPGTFGYNDLPAIRTQVTTLAGDWTSSPIYQKWQAIGGPQTAGPAYDLEKTTADAGRITTFTSGNSAILWRSDLDAHWVHGAIYTAYQQLGGFATYAYPTNDESGTPDGIGRYNHFSPAFGASIYWTPNTGAHGIQGAIRGEWSATGWETGPAGYPTTSESPTPDGIGRYNHFTGRDGMPVSIYWTPNTGAHMIQGAIRQQWANLGWETSWLGYPTSDEYTVTGGRRSDFQSGYIRYDFTTAQATAYHY